MQCQRERDSKCEKGIEQGRLGGLIEEDGTLRNKWFPLLMMSLEDNRTLLRDALNPEFQLSLVWTEIASLCLIKKPSMATRCVIEMMNDRERLC